MRHLKLKQGVCGMTSLNYSYSNNIWQNDRDHLLAFTLNVPFSHWMRTDSQSAFHNSNASYSMSNDLKGGMTNLSGVYGTLLPDNNLNYSVQVGSKSKRHSHRFF